MTEMTPAEAVFFAAAALPAADRAVYLARACAGNDDLRRQVERMLAARPEVGDFLEPPRASPADGGTGTFAPDAPHAGSAEPTADYPGREEQVGTIIGGKYKLIEEIGEGGMGSVYMAQQTEPVKRAVAVKVIKAGMDSKAVLTRFEAERQALAMMDHPNIAKVLDAGTTESGRPFFVMELVKGQPITKFCDERKLTPRQRLELFVPVCNAIQHAHQKGIIHRDIKPSNVLVAMYDDRPVPKVIDFGVAKAAGSTLTDKTLMTGFGAVVGTPEYMSPEQANLNNLDIDTRSDVYSLGVLLYELLTGSTPVDRKSLGKAALLEILRIVREVEAPRPSAKLSTIDTLPSVAANRGTEPAKLSKLMRGELDWVVLKALEKDRTRRYDTANGLARDIQRYLADEIVEARPPSTGYRVKKFVKRHKGQVLAASVVLLALLGGVVGTSSQTLRANRARVAEAEQRTVAEENEKKAVEAGAAEKVASQQAREADAASRRSLARQFVDRGGRLLDEGNYTDALSWFTAAWEKEADVIDPDREAVHRLRVSTTAQMAPKPVHVWKHTEDERVNIQITPDARKVITHTVHYGGNVERRAGTVRVWDLESGRPLTPPLPHRSAYHNFQRFDTNPPSIPTSRDGRRLVTETRDDIPVLTRTDEFKGWTARVWDTETGAAVSPPLPCGGTGWTSLSPDGHRVLTVVPVYSLRNTTPIVTGGEARVWDARTGDPVTPPLVMPGGVVMASFAADGTRVITGHPYPGTCMVWDAQSGQALTPLLRTTVAKTYRPADGNVLPEGCLTVNQTRFVAVEADAPANTPPRIWDVRTGRPLTPTLPLEDFVGSGGEISSDGSRVLFGVAAPATSLRVADVATGKTVATLKAQLSDRPLRFAGFSPDGKWVYGTSAYLGRPEVDANADFDTIWVWDAQTGSPRTSTLRCEGTLNAIDFSADGLQILLRGKNATKADLPGGVQVWNFPSGKPVTPTFRHQGRSTNGAFGPDGRDVLTFGGTHARIWDISTGLPRTPVLPHHREVTDAKFTPDGRFVVTACAGGRVVVWPTRAGEPVGTLLTPGEPVYRLEVDSTGTRMLTDSAKQRLRPSGQLTGGNLTKTEPNTHVRLWDLTTGRSQTLDSIFSNAMFSPDGKWVVTTSHDFNIITRNFFRVWDARTLALVKTIPIRAAIGLNSINTDSVLVYEVLTDAFEKTAGDGSATTQPSKPDRSGTAPSRLRDKTEFRALRLPDGEPVTPAPTAHTFKRDSDVRVVGGTTIRVPRKSPLPDLTISPDGGADSGWVSADGKVLWSAGRQTPLARYMMEVLEYKRNVAFMEVLKAKRDVVFYANTEQRRCEVRAWDARSGEPLLPPLTAQGVSDFSSKDVNGHDRFFTNLKAQTFVGPDRYGVVYPSPDGVRLWEFPRDGRSASEWTRLAIAVGGNRLAEGALAAVSDQDWASARAAFPEAVQPTPGSAAWASRMAAEAELAEDLVAARFHLDRLIALEPNDWRHYRRRGKVTVDDSETMIRINTKAIDLGATAWQVWHNRGLGYAHRGQWAEAEADFEKATQILDEKDGRPWNWLLYARLARGDVAGYRKAFAAATALAGPDVKGLEYFDAIAMGVLVADVVPDPKQLDTWVATQKQPSKHHVKYGEVSFRAGRYDEALTCFLGILETKPLELGERSPYLAMAYHRLGRPDEAKKMLAQAIDWHDRHVEKRQANPATGQPLTLEKRVEFAALLWEAESLIGAPSPQFAALLILEEKLRLARVNHGPEHAETLAGADALARAYQAAGKWDRALPLYRELLANARKTLPKDSLQLAKQLAFVGQSLLETKAFTEAEPLLRECLAIREEKAPNAGTTFNAKSLLGGALLGQKKYADAEPLLLAGYEGMKPPSSSIPEALDRLIELYTATNKPGEVKKWRAERAKYPEVAPPPREKK